MKKFSLYFILLFSSLIFSATSYAEWKFVARTVDSDKYYIDTDRIIKKNKLIYYWELTDYADEGGYGYLSDVTRVVVDCDLNRYKNLQITNYKGAMGTGNVTGSGDISETWVYPVPKSIKETSTAFVCKQFK